MRSSDQTAPTPLPPARLEEIRRKDRERGIIVGKGPRQDCRDLLRHTEYLTRLVRSLVGALTAECVICSQENGEEIDDAWECVDSQELLPESEACQTGFALAAARAAGFGGEEEESD